MNSSLPTVTPVTTIPNYGQSIFLAILVLIMMFFSSALIFLFLGLFSTQTPETLALDPTILAITLFFSVLASYSFLIGLTRNYFKQHFLPQISSSFPSALFAISLGISFALLVLWLQQIIPPQTELNLTIANALTSDGFGKWLVIIVAILFAPVFEEYLFRGLIFDSLFKQWGIWVATLGSSILFTSFHLFEYHQYWLAWFSVFCLAIILAFVRHKSDSMLNPILLHAIYNTTLIIMGSD